MEFAVHLPGVLFDGDSAWLRWRKHPGGHIFVDASHSFVAGIAILLVGGLKIVWLARSEVHERRGAYSLLFTVLCNSLLLRFALLSAGLLMLPFAQSRWTAVPVALALMAGEFVGRYLFFVSVVPTNIATEYLSVEAA